MASLDGEFNANEVEPVSFDVIPAGQYRACIVGSERKKTKSGNGDIIKLTLQVLEGPFKNRKVFENINYTNPSAKAQQIGRGTLSAICRAVGVMNPSDTTQLHNRPMVIKVGVRQEEGRQPQNDVKSYEKDGGQGQGPQDAAPSDPTPTQPAGGSPAGVWG